MGLFSYVYYSSLIRVSRPSDSQSIPVCRQDHHNLTSYHLVMIQVHHVTVGSVLQTIVSSLTVEEQVEVLVDLKRYLDGQGVKLNAAIRALGK